MSTAFLKPLAAIAALAALAAYATIMLQGPQGLTALEEKRSQIKELEDQNATLMRDIATKKQRIERLEHDPSTQALEVQKRLGKVHPGDTEFKISSPPSATIRAGGPSQAQH